MTLYQNCLNHSAVLNKIATRAKNRKNLLITPPKWVDGFLKTFTGMYLGWFSTKITQTVLLCWIRRQPELKIEKPLNFSPPKLMDVFWRISQEYPMSDLLPKLLKLFHSAKLLTRLQPELKIEKTFKQLLLKGWMDFERISQECSMGDSLPKLIKLFYSAKQYSHQSKK